ncbi:hypothetical protein TH63_13520 [Rufibacter radiotolerans]|uniref:Uncharacterized protein n=1 Tax=Rufibacter radiotolerans TaxID=1379910 RepID=A0A0H4W7J3_9BACT|nr:hypothetical protein [Rufibacter radiotolerans]AKQ46411.1 hypothetical protein TH63_13520 [Rufibacter radiotolerans]
MKNNLLLSFAIILSLGFGPKYDSATELEYELTRLIRSFSSNTQKEKCEDYFQEIKLLKNKIEDAIKEGEENPAAFRKLEKRIDGFHDFATTLTGCNNSNTELGLINFNTFLRETGLSPVLVKQSDCVTIYRVNMNGFQSYYAVNKGKAKMVKVAVKKGDKYNSSSSTYSFGLRCNSVEGFSQGNAQGKVNTMSISCTPLNLECY